jgi:hypothetical protein
MGHGLSVMGIKILENRRIAGIIAEWTGLWQMVSGRWVLAVSRWWPVGTVADPTTMLSWNTRMGRAGHRARQNFSDKKQLFYLPEFETERINWPQVNNRRRGTIDQRPVTGNQ